MLWQCFCSFYYYKSLTYRPECFALSLKWFPSNKDPVYLWDAVRKSRCYLQMEIKGSGETLCFFWTYFFALLR